MYFKRFVGVMCFSAVAIPFVLTSSCLALEFGQTEQPQLASVSLAVSNDRSNGVSSSQTSLVDAPGFFLAYPIVSPVASPLATGRNAQSYAQGNTHAEKVSTRPFSAFAVGVKVGMGGVGLDVSTPLGARLNLRGGASFLNISPVIEGDGMNMNSSISFRSVATSVDVFPFGGSFRISPGVVLYNGNHLHGSALIAGGQTFELNNVKYYSSNSAEVNGTIDMTFGNKVAPSLTAGFGNMIPRKLGQHWSIPVEVGFQYIGVPSVALTLSGNACQGIYCAPVMSDPATRANVAAEQQNLNNEVSALRFYPIASTGLAYKFGGSGSR